MRIQRVIGGVLARLAISDAMRQLGARVYHSGIPGWAYIRRAVRSFACSYASLKPDLVISHDFFTCDVGFEVASNFKSKFIVDCHEYFRGQLSYDQHWVKNILPYIIGFQDYYLSRADGVTTVCEGIATLLNKEQKLQHPVQVVRSVPYKNIQSFVPCGEKIRVLYHGDISYVRGLHKAVRSLALWRSEFHLIIRGNGDPAYIEDLKKIASELGVANRLQIEPPVAFNQIIPEANRSDIGYFVHKDISPQKRFALPNKFFEYIMAGLALCVGCH
jgi:glycosyltransferase involved in cell wall biosynthesis